MLFKVVLNKIKKYAKEKSKLFQFAVSAIIQQKNAAENSKDMNRGWIIDTQKIKVIIINKQRRNTEESRIIKSTAKHKN